MERVSTRIHSTQVAKPVLDLHVAETKRFPQNSDRAKCDRKLSVPRAPTLKGLKSNYYSNIIEILLQIFADLWTLATSSFGGSPEEIVADMDPYLVSEEYIPPGSNSRPLC
jgi:hypothetical protein